MNEETQKVKRSYDDIKKELTQLVKENQSKIHIPGTKTVTTLEVNTKEQNNKQYIKTEIVDLILNKRQNI